MAAQVGLFFVTFHKELVGFGIQLPVDVLGGLAGVVLPMFGKLYGEAVHRTFVDARDEALHHLFGHELQVVVLCYFRKIQFVFHSSLCQLFCKKRAKVQLFYELMVIEGGV